MSFQSRSAALVLNFLFLLTSCAKNGGVSESFDSPQPAERFEMNDVAILMPLPTDEMLVNEMLWSESKGTFGDLLPMWLWDKMPTLRTGLLRSEVKRELRVVAIRLDPCFRSGANVERLPCQPLIRLVLQPVFYDKSLKTMSTRDAAVHLFFKVDLEQLKQLAKQIQSLSSEMRDEFVGKPLDVHPLLLKVGYASPVYKTFRSLLLTHLGEQKLTRVTFMTVAGLDVQWVFGGFDILSERVKADIVIPGTQRRVRQTLTSDTSFPVPMFSDLDGPGVGPDNLSIFESGASLLRATADVQLKTMLSMHRVENPDVHNPGTVDCVSCHLTTMARAWSLEKGLPSAEASEHSYVSFNNVLNVSQANPRTNVLRAFGYFHEKTAVSLRTLFEVDTTLRFLNQHFTN